MNIKIAITHGDMNGIGYEVILKALEDSRMLELCTPVIYGSAKIAQFWRKALDLPQMQLVQIPDATQAREGAINIVNVVGEEVHPEPGADTPEAGKAALAALEAATAALRAGEVDALVTAPINKHNVQTETFIFPGHTEYLEATLGDGARSLMILCAEQLRVALVTGHIPVTKVSQAITTELIEEKLRIFSRSLHRDFAVGHPRIAVLALNPHAGEGGLLGSEEAEIIKPAVDAAREKGIMAFGPYPADGFFGSGAYTRFDGILAMYHDQGLAPFKTIAMEQGVNYTAGLPYVRTSPAHGTGYDIAGQGKASEESMRCAIYAAIDIVRARRNEDEAHANPLQRHYKETPERGVRIGRPDRKDKPE